MIEDKELRDLFAVECEEHLQSLDAGLLRLEKKPEEKAVLEDVFREAHSLKGAARMLGITDVEVIAHHLEDVLGAAHHGKQALTSDVIDRLYHALDAVRKFVEEAVTGKATGLVLGTVLDALAGKAFVATEEPVPEKPAVEKKSAIAKFGTVELTPSSEPSPGKTSLSSGKGSDKLSHYRISTMRVDPGKLDDLMTHSGELEVTRSRIVRRIVAVNELIALKEEWIKGEAAHALVLRERKRRGASLADVSRKVSVQERLDRLGILLNTLQSGINEDSARLDHVTAKLNDGIRSIRMLPFSTIFNLFPRMVRDLAREEGKEVNLVIEGEDISADKRVLEDIKDPLTHMIRNAISHGIELPDERQRAEKPGTGTIHLKAFQTPNNVVIEVTDDGRGLDTEAIKRAALKRKLFRKDVLNSMTPAQIHNLIFSSGLSTKRMITDVSGRGVGLDVVRTSVEQLKGSVEIESDSGCTIRMRLPVTMATIKVLIAVDGGHTYAIPVEFIETSQWLSMQEIFPVEGRATMVFEGQAVSVVRLGDILEIETAGGQEQGSPAEGVESRPVKWPCMVLNLGGERLGVLVDALLDEQDIVLKSQCSLLRRVRNVSSATILGSGDVCMVLNPADMIRSVRKHEISFIATEEETVEEVGHRVLLVDDSITTLTQEKRILVSAGYEVETAVDGIDAWGKLSARPFDAVVTDIQMPNMDGLSLTEKIRKGKTYETMPVILVTMLSSDEDRKRGMEAGADAYIMKPAFDQKVLLDALERLI